MFIVLVSVAAYTARPIIPAEKPELISVAEAMHREKFGERVKSLFEPETEAAIKAMESGYFDALLVPSFLVSQLINRDCNRIYVDNSMFVT